MKLLGLPVLLLLTTALAQRQPVPPGGFKNCTQARAAGYHDIRRRKPGHAKKLDRDGDGVAGETENSAVAASRTRW